MLLMLMLLLLTFSRGEGATYLCVLSSLQLGYISFTMACKVKMNTYIDLRSINMSYLRYLNISFGTIRV